ncbi:MAG: isocitrate lyase/phosphoenolpyruvate mutase family protein [Actinomycetota bacterium]
MSARFEELHRSGTFLLVNVHDAGAAVVAEAAGAVAVGTTSSGHANTLGRVDGSVRRGEAIERAAEIAAAVDVPVSVDAENGWGHTPEEVAATITELAAVGVAGASIEDWSNDEELGLYDEELAVERIEAAVEVARALPEPFVVCARAEGFLRDAADPLAMALDRLPRFAAAGAGCVYAPGPRDRDTISRLVARSGAPVNVLIGMGSELTMDDARELGVRRVSLGGSLYRATMTAFHDLVRQVTTSGSFAVDRPLLDGRELASWTRPDPA